MWFTTGHAAKAATGKVSIMNTVRTPNNSMASASVTKRWLAAAVFVVGAITAPMFLDAAVAHADTPDPGAGQANCEGAGGRYSTAGSVTTCCFTETINSQGHHCFNYLGGDMIGTNIVAPTSPSTNPRPVLPRAPGVPPAAGSNQGAAG